MVLLTYIKPCLTLIYANYSFSSVSEVERRQEGPSSKVARLSYYSLTSYSPATKRGESGAGVLSSSMFAGSPPYYHSPLLSVKDKICGIREPRSEAGIERGIKLLTNKPTDLPPICFFRWNDPSDYPASSILQNFGGTYNGHS